MSILAYAAFTTTREDATINHRRQVAHGGDNLIGQNLPASNPPPAAAYITALAALVPAEILIAHATILAFTTETGKAVPNPAGSAGAAGEKTPELLVVITNTFALQLAFWSLLVLSLVLYIGGRLTVQQPVENAPIPRWGRLDYVRMLIPPLSFVAWTMIQKGTAFDAVAPPSVLAWQVRGVIAIIGAMVLGALATILAYKVPGKP